MGECFKEQHTLFMSNTYSSFSKSWFLLIDLIQVPMNWIIATSGNSPIIVIMVWAEKNSAEFFFTSPHQHIAYLPAIILHTGGPVWAIWFSATTKIFKKIYKVICIISSTIMHIKENPILLIYNYINCTWTFLRWKN